LDRALGTVEKTFFQLLNINEDEREIDWGTRVCNLYDKILDIKDLILLKRYQLEEWHLQLKSGWRDGDRSKEITQSYMKDINKKKEKGI
jgi:hypothetical protein